LSSMHLNGRTEELQVYGPPPLKEIIDIHLLYSETKLRYPLIFNATQSKEEQVIMVNEDLSVRSFPLNHRIPCTGFRFDEKPHLARINIEAVTELGIPTKYYPSIKRGEDYVTEGGQVYKSS